MANLQVKNIPDTLHRKIQRAARQNNQTLGEFVVAAVEKELANAAFRARLSERPTTQLPIRASSLLEEARLEREEEQT
jgi:plasmid stability protein